MPKTKTTRKQTKRSAPYELRTSTVMAATMASPVGHWNPTMSWPDMGYQQMDQMIPTYQPQPVMPPQHTPVISHPGQSAPWTPREDDLLIDAKSRGMGWNDIHMKCFPNKSGNACRKRHERLMQKMRTTDWDEPRIRKVMVEYNTRGMREEMWGKLADRIGERWEDVERVAFQQGLKGLRNTTSSHSRARSQASSGLGLPSDYDRHSPRVDYQPKYGHHHDDSGIELDITGHSRRSSGTVPGMREMMRPHYDYS